MQEGAVPSYLFSTAINDLSASFWCDLFNYVDDVAFC